MRTRAAGTPVAMSEHRDRADRAERDLEDLEHRSEQLGEDIEDARADWERKKGDDSVPGAAGKPDAAASEPGPEASYPTKDAGD